MIGVAVIATMLVLIICIARPKLYAWFTFLAVCASSMAVKSHRYPNSVNLSSLIGRITGVGVCTPFIGS